MNKKNTSRILYAALALSVAIGLFYVFLTYRLQNQLTEQQEEESLLRARVEAYQELLRIDSILVRGDYGSALQAYEQQVSNRDMDEATGIELRVELAQQLMRLSIGENPLRDSGALRDTLDSLRTLLSRTPSEIKQYDSLGFALEKSKVQLANMRRQLQQKSFGEYLNFKSQKGAQMHYVGQVKNNKANGYGVALLDTGSRYEGEWRDNQRHGEGAFYWADGEYYNGSYRNDQRNGLGTYYWPNGEKYVGQWKDDKRNGKGVFYGEDGEVLTSGIWKDDKLVTEDQN